MHKSFILYGFSKVPVIAIEKRDENPIDVSECITQEEEPSTSTAAKTTSPFIFEEKKNRMLFRDFKLPEQVWFIYIIRR